MSNKLLLLIILLKCCCPGSTDKKVANKNLNVLMLSDPTLSHLATLLAVGEELAHRGHNVTLMTIVSQEQQPEYKSHVEKHGVHLWNISSEGLVPLYLISQTNKDVSVRFVLKMLSMAMEYGSSMAKILTSHLNTTLSTGSWDIVLGNNYVQALLLCMKSVYDVPLVSVGLSLEISTHSYPQWPWPGFVQGAVSDDMSFSDRFLSVIYNNAYKFMLHGIFYTLCPELLQNYCPEVSTTQLLSSVGDHIPDIRPTVMGFEYPITMLPMTEYVGPLVSRYPAPLSGELGDWLQSKHDKSVVYASTGSILLLDEVNSREILEGVMDTNFSLLWSLRKSNQWILDGLDVDPDRVLILDWTPQLSVLGSEAIHSAILHGGFNGLSEALWNGVPVVVVPQVPEQLYNAGRIKFNGLGIHLNAETLSSSKITESLKALDTEEYRSKVTKLQKVMRMAGGVERAADLVEFYEDVGYSHLVPAYAKYQWSVVQYYNADVYALMVLVLVITVMCLKTCCKYVCKKCCSRVDKKKKD